MLATTRYCKNNLKPFYIQRKKQQRRFILNTQSICEILYDLISLSMDSSTSPLIRPKDIKLGQSIIIDASGGPGAFDKYVKKHVQGALHADLDRDLSMKPVDPAHGGRHPLPDIKDFTAFLGRLGITP